MKGPRKSRRQRHFEKGMKSQEPDCEKGVVRGKWEVPGDIGALQMWDEILKPLFEKVVGGLDMTNRDKECFLGESDVFYAVADGVKRLVVPASCRPLIMHLVYTLPWAGHLGRNKT